MTRTCPGCLEDKPPAKPRGRYCVECSAIGRQRRHRLRTDTPESIRRRSLFKLYGITPEDYDRMRAEQQRRCAVCQRHEDDCPVVSSGRPRQDGQPKAQPRPLVVDHDHRTGRVRGLLCSRCNTVLGMVEEDAALLRRAVAYLYLAAAEEVAP